MAQVVEHVGWGRKIGESFKGILVGLLLFFGSFVLLGWNELNTVRNYRTVSEGRKIVVEADAAAVDASPLVSTKHVNRASSGSALMAPNSARTKGACIVASPPDTVTPDRKGAATRMGSSRSATAR